MSRVATARPLAGGAAVGIMVSMTPATAPAAAFAATSTTGAAASASPWLDPSRSPDVRARALVDAMTLDEKIQLVHGVAVCNIKLGPEADRTLGGAGFVPGIPRLGVPDINYTDGPVGVANCGARPGGAATVLPAPIGRAATWSPRLADEAGRLLGREARVQGFTGMLGTVAEVIREPRWGRAFEAFSEDPLLNAVLAEHELRGTQREKVVGTIKHYALNHQETNRQTHSVEVGERALRELHLLPYELAIPRSDVQNVMCSYNRIGGTYASEHPELLRDVLKGEFGFKGQVQSDWGATHSTVAAARAGLDEEQFIGEHFGPALKWAVRIGAVLRARLDDMVHRKLRGLISVGVYDDPPGPPRPVDVAAGNAVAERIARRSMVLLKNARRPDGTPMLPLPRSVRSIALIGSHADKGVLSGSGSSQVSPVGGPAVEPHGPAEVPGGCRSPIWVPSSPMEQIENLAPNATVRYVDGADPAAAARLAATSDVAIVFGHEWRGEFDDRESLALPVLGPPEWPVAIDQEALIERVGAANPNTVVVLEHGGPVTMPWLPRVRGVLAAWYPGSRGGRAIADVLFGAVNPSGRLPVTFPVDVADGPTGAGPVDDGDTVGYDESLRVGYRWYDARGVEPLFPFGHGLSYTRFGYSRLRVTPSAVRNGRGLDRRAARVRVRVTNVGRTAGIEVVQVYAELPASAGEPPRRLVGFAEVELRPGQHRTVTIDVPCRNLAIWDVARHRWTVPAGRYRIGVGGSSRGIRAGAPLIVRPG